MTTACISRRTIIAFKRSFSYYYSICFCKFYVLNNLCVSDYVQLSALFSWKRRNIDRIKMVFHLHFHMIFCKIAAVYYVYLSLYSNLRPFNIQKSDNKPVWIRWCTFKLLSCVKVTAQSLHLYRFSPTIIIVRIRILI